MNKKRILSFLCMFMSVMTIGFAKDVQLKIIFTTDVHGNYFPYDFINQKEWGGSLARVYKYVQDERKEYGDRLILIDNGDILQGQPTAYYSNFIDTVSPHICASVMNYMNYDIGNIGNHDVETGRNVMERWIKDCQFPILGANIIDVTTDQSLLPPYVILERDGVKIAVLGMITPAIPVWLPENLWKGLVFEDMQKTAEKWVNYIQELEQPDILIGVFHAGQQPQQMGEYLDNASLLVAENIPGFDVVMFGHDHQHECKTIDNVDGEPVLVINPANNAFAVGEVDIKLVYDQNTLIDKEVSGKLTDLKDSEVSKSFMTHFTEEYKTINDFVTAQIGTFENTISTRDAYFGPSAFVDLIHSLQLEIGNADISFAAPLSFDVSIQKGDVFVSDMFNLYKFENTLYVMELTGQEIKDYLEMSYGMWLNQMQSPEDNLLLLKQTSEDRNERSIFKNFTYNFDSAAGIIYEVDVTKPDGEKIKIKNLSDGSIFDLNKTYRVALNSYRGNGGGELLTKGAKIPHEDLTKRIIYATDKDLRYYLMQEIIKQKNLNPQPLNQWKIIPEAWVNPAIDRDYKLLFNSNK